MWKQCCGTSVGWPAHTFTSTSHMSGAGSQCVALITTMWLIDSILPIEVLNESTSYGHAQLNGESCP